MFMPSLPPDPAWDEDCRAELTLAELVDDPLVRLLMASDGVDPRRIRKIFGNLASRDPQPSAGACSR